MRRWPPGRRWRVPAGRPAGRPARRPPPRAPPRRPRAPCRRRARAGGSGSPRTLPVVAHHPEVTAGYGDLELPVRVRAAGRVPGEDVRLVERLAVDLQRARALALHRVAADPDDPFDQVFLLGGRHQSDKAERLLHRTGLRRRLVLQPVARVVEDDDLAALGLGAEPRGQLVDEYPVTLLERVPHGLRGDGERLYQERLDEQGQQQRDHREEREFHPEGTLFLHLRMPCFRYADRHVSHHRSSPHTELNPAGTAPRAGASAARTGRR